MELVPAPGGTMSAGDIDRRIKELETEFYSLFEAAHKEEGGYTKYAPDFQRITNEIEDLKSKKTLLMETQQNDSAANRRINDAMKILSDSSAEIKDWDESLIRQLVDSIKVLSEDRVRICLRGGIEVERFVEKG